MRWQGLFSLVVLVWSVYSQTTVPQPPKVYPPEPGRPKDMKYCRINADTLFPWIVGVWDIAFRQYVGLGSMITYIAFVTSCRQFHKRDHTAYKAIGQYIWNLSLPEQPCMQGKLVSAIYRHPKCISSSKEATFFDYAVFKLKFAFDITGTNYPTANVARSPIELFNRVLYVNIIPNTTGCMLPYFRNQNEQPPVFDFDSFVESIRFHSECVQLLCEKLPPDPAFSKMCEKRFGERAKATMLCMKNKNRKHVQLGANNAYWYTGTPLVCNGTTYGITTQFKDRKRFPQPRWDDIHFVVTFLRVWPWLIGLTREHTAPWVRPIHIEDMNLQAEEFPSPIRESIGGEVIEPTASPHSGAVITTPSLKNMIFLLLLL